LARNELPLRLASMATAPKTRARMIRKTPRKPRSCTPLPFSGDQPMLVLDFEDHRRSFLNGRPANANTSKRFRELGNPACCDGPFFADPAPFPFRQTAPDSELLALRNREFETLCFHLASVADCFCFTRRRSALRKEQIRVSSPAIRVVLPGKIVDRKGIHQTAVHACTPLTYV